MDYLENKNEIEGMEKEKKIRGLRRKLNVFDEALDPVPDEVLREVLKPFTLKEVDHGTLENEGRDR